MTYTVETITPAEADVRWREWRARGVADDRRTASRMRIVVMFVAIGFASWVGMLMF